MFWVRHILPPDTSEARSPIRRNWPSSSDRGSAQNLVELRGRQGDVETKQSCEILLLPQKYRRHDNGDGRTRQNEYIIAPNKFCGGGIINVTFILILEDFTHL